LKPTFFATAAELRAWLEENHPTATELLVGFYKRGSGKPSITWPELVDEALCFGWIDSVRKGIDEVSYANRLTPRKARSTWSAINIARAKELIRLGRMQPAGLKAFSGGPMNGRRSTATNSGRKPSSIRRGSDPFVPTRRPGRFSKRKRLGTETPRSGG